MRTSLRLLAVLSLFLGAFLGVGTARADADDADPPPAPAPVPAPAPAPVPAEKPVERGYVGFQPAPAALLPPEIREQRGIQATSGVVVIAVLRKGPAEKAGLKVGDVLVEINGHAVPETKDVDLDDPQGSMTRFAEAFMKVASTVKAGTEVAMVVERGGERVTLRATAVDRITRDRLAAEEAKGEEEKLASPPDETALRRGYLGFQADAASALSAEERAETKVTAVQGVVVVRVVKGSPAEKAGLRVGDVLLRYAATALPTNEELEAAKEKAAERVEETIARAGKALKPGEEVEVVVLREGKPVTLKAVAEDFATMEKLAPSKEDGEDDADDDEDDGEDDDEDEDDDEEERPPAK